MKKILSPILLLFVAVLTVSAQSDNILVPTVSPANGTTVSKLDKVTLTFDTDMIDGMVGYGASDQYGSFARQIAVYNAKGDSVSNIIWNYTTDYTQLVLKLTTTMTAKGTYTFTLPEGYVWEYDDSYQATGRKTKETTYVYGIGQETGIEEVQNEESNVKNSACYNLAGQRIDASSSNFKGIVIRNGKKFINK